MARKRKNAKKVSKKVEESNSNTENTKEMTENESSTDAQPAAAADTSEQLFKILRVESTVLESDNYEVELTVTATVKLGEEVAYLIEIKQAGLFMIKGFETERLGPMLGSFCPNILFPFAREEIAALVQKGGFPQMLLDPVNFDALYAQHLSQAKQNAPAPQTAQ